MTDRPRNVAASVRARLVTRAHEVGEAADSLFTRYAIERLLHRLSLSPHRDEFVLKGAMLLVAWGGDVARPTRDLDLLGRGEPSLARLAAIFRAICAVAVEDDGLVWDLDAIRTAPIAVAARYQGVRVRLTVGLGTARLRLQVDVGFGDATEPPPEEIDYPTLFDQPAPRLRAYRPETVVAEKLHAAAVFGDANSRFKDFHDLLALHRLFGFEPSTLAPAIRATFARRGTALPGPDAPGLGPAFFADPARGAAWRAWLDRNRLAAAPRDFGEVGEVLRGFLLPALEAAR